MDMRPEIIISLAAVLLASQVAVIITLIVLCKKFKTLKQEVHKYKVKKNRESLSGLIVKDPKDKKSRPCNQYVDGKRHPSTMVRTNSKESIVYVPTPAPERRSKNLGDREIGYELSSVQSSGDPNSSSNDAGNVIDSSCYQEDEEVYGNQVVIDMVESSVEADQAICSKVDSNANTNDDPSTPCIEEVNVNTGYTHDTEEIYGNQDVIDMVKSNAAGLSSGSDEQSASNVNIARNGAKSKKRKEKSDCKKAMSQKLKPSVESERTIEVEESFHEGDNNVAQNEPIYMNLRGEIPSTEA